MLTVSPASYPPSAPSEPLDLPPSYSMVKRGDEALRVRTMLQQIGNGEPATPLFTDIGRYAKRSAVNTSELSFACGRLRPEVLGELKAVLANSPLVQRDAS